MAKHTKTIKHDWDRHAVAGEKLADRIHRTAMDTLDHYRVHGDTSLCAYAINTMRKRGTNRRALIQWFQKYGRMTLTVIDQKKGTVGFTKKPGSDHTTIDLDKANTSPFYADDEADGRTGEDTKTFNLLGRLKTLTKTSDKIVEAGFEGYDKTKTDLGDGGLRDELDLLIEKYSANDTAKPVFDTAVVQRMAAG